ncbi:MAG: formylglycine-generating enzyme family protein [Kiritimatiellae bacterium]|nr:formylglycine-generating enzyme family protein [Kiritimatiellia bacterium]
MPSQNSTTNNLRFSLPTEAEWEYACRAGTTNRFYSGDSDSDLDRVGWYTKNSEGATHPVGQKQPNAWGLYDMHGNVQEWCADESVAMQNPKGTNSDNARILRGGNSTSSPKDCRAATRFMADPGAQSSGSGFRVVLHP